MRINKYIAERSDLSRRAADEAIAQNRVRVNGALPTPGQQIKDSDVVVLDDRILNSKNKAATIILNKPTGYICSRDGQGNQTVFDLLPAQYQHLECVGKLDKNSSGLLVFTNDGALHNELTHPSYNKQKRYLVVLDKPLADSDYLKITEHGVNIGDSSPSRFALAASDNSATHKRWQATLTEGRNRQIRRTFGTLGYLVTSLRRTHFGPYALGDLAPGKIKEV